MSDHRRPPGRAVVAQQAPRVPLAGFPAYRLSAETVAYRAHHVARGPWWFGSDGAGRFDLPAPRGTCYLATSAVVALRERLGAVLGGSPYVAASLLEDVVVSRLRVPATRRLANLLAARASDYGVTRELETMTPYDVPQAWARAFDDEGLQGVRYGPRFTTGAAASVALFEAAGTPGWDGDPEPLPAADLPGGPRPMPAPRRGELTVVRPPRTRTQR